MRFLIHSNLSTNHTVAHQTSLPSSARLVIPSGMPSSISHRARGPREFATTQWSVVLAAGGDTSRAAPALAKLCSGYWYPIYAFIRRQGRNAHDAQDLTQGFFAELIERESLAGVVKDRGRFRTWLLAVLKHFLANEWHRTQRKKRGGGAVIVSLDDEAERRFLAEPIDPSTAEKLFDRSWALTLVDRALSQLENEWRDSGKRDQFQILKGTLTGERAAYPELAQRLGLSESNVRVTVHRLRGRYRDLLRSEISQTVAFPGDAEDELRQLFAALGD
jgi:RNA polymerase sigma factor (sigma-70 family)